MVGDNNTARPRGTDSAKVIQVIVTEGLIGRGTKEDPCRNQRRYWTFEGKLIATEDDLASCVRDGCSILDN